MSFVCVGSVDYSDWQTVLQVYALLQTNKRKKGTIKNKPAVVKGKKLS
jgi:hypothetical protein